MNLPNKLTVLRVILIPVFIYFMLSNVGEYNRYIALAIFCIACLTDFFDGYIARKYNLVTNFGKFMDPLADKLLVISALILLTNEGSFPVLGLEIIIAREFIISGFRLIAADNNVVIAASMSGKLKTVITMITCIVLISGINYPNSNIVNKVLIYATIISTVLSLIEYIYKNRAIILDGNI